MDQYNEVKNKIDEERELLLAAREQYNHENEDRQITRLENEVNVLVSKRNNMKALYDSYTKKINELDKLEEEFDKLFETEKGELEDESN